MFSERSAIFEINVLFPEYLLSLKYMLLYFTKDFFIRLTSPTDTKSAMLKLIKQQFNKHKDLLSCYTTLNTASIIKQKGFYFFLKVVLKRTWCILYNICPFYLQFKSTSSNRRLVVTSKF